jgi:DNA-binding NtrC family response regulator
MIGQSSKLTAAATRDFSEHPKKSPAVHILVVDDERLVRWAIGETLGDQGYEIEEAGDGESAMRAVLAPHPPALVLLDLRLPDTDDLRVASFIRAHAPDTPVVLMTAFATPEVVDEATGLGITVIAKPFDINALASIVERALAARGD